MFAWLKTIGHRTRGGASDGYPFDFDASQRWTRPSTGIDYWPSHSNRDNYAQLGCVSGFWPQQDAIVWGAGFARAPFGPSTMPVVNLQYVMTIPGLTKQLPQY